MKVLVLNGSPGGKGNTLRITEAFLEGLEAAGKQNNEDRRPREKIDPASDASPAGRIRQENA